MVHRPEKVWERDCTRNNWCCWSPSSSWTLDLSVKYHFTADITVVENPVVSATNEEAMDVTGGGETDPELPLGTSTDVGVGINGSGTTPQLPKPKGSCAKVQLLCCGMINETMPLALLTCFCAHIGL